MTTPSRERIHASSVAIAGWAVVLRGPPGSGKSDLALRLIDAGAMLIADDQTIVERNGSTLVAHPPEPIRGRIEVRGLGIVGLPDAGPTPVGLIVDLVPDRAIERMPPDNALIERLMDVEVPRVAVDPSLPGAVAKVRAALAHFRVSAGDNDSLVSSGDR